LASVFLTARTSLLRANRRISTLASGAVLASELTKAWMPSVPENAVSPRSETMNHWVVRSP